MNRSEVSKADEALGAPLGARSLCHGRASSLNKSKMSFSGTKQNFAHLKLLESEINNFGNITKKNTILEKNKIINFL